MCCSIPPSRSLCSSEIFNRHAIFVNMVNIIDEADQQVETFRHHKTISELGEEFGMLIVDVDLDLPPQIERRFVGSTAYFSVNLGDRVALYGTCELDPEVRIPMLTELGADIVAEHILGPHCSTPGRPDDFARAFAHLPEIDQAFLEVSLEVATSYMLG
jgi:hypothetical protein